MSKLEQIKALERAIITPDEAARVLQCNAQYIRMQARADASKLGFPVICLGRRVKIPRLPFIAFVEGGGWQTNEKAPAAAGTATGAPGTEPRQ